MRIVIILIILLNQNIPCFSQHWECVGGGTDHTYWNVNGLYSYDSLLCVCGGFDSIAGGTIPSESFASWNGNNWIPGGIDFDFGGVRCLTKFNGDLHIAGSFSGINGNPNFNDIAKIDSNGNLVQIGSGGTNGFGIKCMQVYDGNLYIGGQFTMVDDTINAWRIARWDGTNWHPMGTVIHGGFGDVTSMAVFQNELYVGGDFGSIDGLPVRNKIGRAHV